MRVVRLAWLFIVLFFVTWGWILWKSPKGQAQDQFQPPADLAEVVKKQFGSCFEVATERSAAKINYLHPKAEKAWVDFLAADLDGDGVEDAVIVARCKTPFVDQVSHNYKVIDPYYTNFGYGDPKITVQFNATDPDHQNLVLVIHGAGNEAWRAANPKAKFVIINLPFDNLALTQVMRRRRPISAISLLEEEQQLSSAVYWDGKKYKWADTAGNQ